MATTWAYPGVPGKARGDGVLILQGVEAVPFAGDRVWEGHQVLLAKNGIYILETLDTRELIADGVSEFLFVLGQPLYRGAVQAIINPVAIR